MGASALPPDCVLSILYGSRALLIPIRLAREDPILIEPNPGSHGSPGNPRYEPVQTRAEAQSEIGRLVNEQLEAFSVQRKAIEEQSRSARVLVDKVATEADNALKRNQAACEEQIAQQVRDLRTQAQTSVSTVSDKLAEIESRIKAHMSFQEDAGLKLVQ